VLAFFIITIQAGVTAPAVDEIVTVGRTASNLQLL
jgi:hypothetical protein